MNGTYDLYNGMPPNVRDSDTSEAAADAIQGAVLPLREQAYQYILDHGGATTWDLVDDAGMLYPTACARVRELVLTRRIIDSGTRRMTKSKRQATVWIPSNEPAVELPPRLTAKQQLREARERIEQLEREVWDLSQKLKQATRQQSLPFFFPPTKEEVSREK